MANNVVTSKKSLTRREVFFHRLFSTLALWGFVVATFYFNQPWLWFAFVAAVTIGGLIEYFHLFRDAGFSRYRWHCYVLAVVYLVGLFADKLGLSWPVENVDLEGFIVAVLIISVFLSRLRQPLEGEKTLHEIAVSVFGVLYIVFLFGFVLKLLQLPLDPGQGENRAYLIYLLAVTKFTDMGAYCIGSLFGKDKMVPNISPGKTWQGFWGAIFAALVASFGCMVLFGDRIALITPVHAGVLAVGLALVAVLGDLAESIVKRSLQAKDSGKVIPGIGGILDLIDSLLFTAPVLYFYLKLVV